MTVHCIFQGMKESDSDNTVSIVVGVTVSVVVLVIGGISAVVGSKFYKVCLMERPTYVQ